ncbi:hypothetical protein AQUCO_02600268v1 [Aquilegia coerulea]|uniref:Cytochrome P450 n=1 Tax=Aquilegia coerulea TaxID=218851 RepID=A0A2G5D868_AQUCA|nr:hypothetical protein AQUCO_02600268v1 [Aquilegia coerulea]
MAKKYGPIMSILLGLVPTIIVTSPEYAEVFLKIHDLNFASRPIIYAANYVSYRQKNLVFPQYGPYWRNICKLCTIELHSSSKIEFFKPIRREELVNFVESMNVAAKSGSVIDVSAKIESVIEDITN